MDSLAAHPRHPPRGFTRHGIVPVILEGDLEQPRSPCAGFGSGQRKESVCAQDNRERRYCELLLGVGVPISNTFLTVFREKKNEAGKDHDT